MGLAVSIGVLADFLLADEEAGVEWFVSELEFVNRVLAENGLATHEEPRDMPEYENRAPINGYPYSFLHYLRRVAALRFNDPEYLAIPFPNGEEPDHPLLEKEYELLRSHLICHSDAEGFYVPQDFTDVLFDDTCGELTGTMLGSSQQLLRELISVAPALGIALEGTQLTDEEAAQLAEEIDREEPLWIVRICPGLENGIQL